MAKLGLSGRVAQKKKDRVINQTEVIGNMDIADELQLMNECLTQLSVKIYNWIPNIREVGSFEELCSKEIGEDEDKLCLKNLQRRIREQTIIAYVIRPGTPENVRNSIFTRINTGGTQLTPAEIKNSVYRGQAANFLKELAHSEAFIRATNGKIKPDRMLDCEFVNRFLAFYLLDLNNYRDNLEQFFNEVLLKLKAASPQELNDYRSAFFKSMETAYTVFGKVAFRKLQANQKYGRINKPLFECVSVCLAKLTGKECETLCKNKDVFLKKYKQLLCTASFIDVITNGTAKRTSIEQRNNDLNRVIYEAIKRIGS